MVTRDEAKMWLIFVSVFFHFNMINNKTFYIRYQENQPVGIETHFNSAGEHRERPLSSVAHLIQGIGIIIGSIPSKTWVSSCKYRLWAYHSSPLLKHLNP
jgi:hypothetical protein